LEDYLEILVQYYQEEQEELCNICSDKCIDYTHEDSIRSSVVTCDICTDECQKMESMEHNGYIDASVFLKCNMIYDPEDDAVDTFYAGSICSDQGSKIKIGVYHDEDCNVWDRSKAVDEYLKDGDGYRMKLSHNLLKKTYHSEIMLSCANDDDASRNSNVDEESEILAVHQVCQDLYDRAAKCETPFGLQLAAQDTHYRNQKQEEAKVCKYIQQLKTGKYQEKGTVLLDSSSGEFVAATPVPTIGQTFLLVITGSMVLAMLLRAIKLQRSISVVQKIDSSSGASYHTVQLSEVSPMVNDDQQA
jgi:hypothetical protein